MCRYHGHLVVEYVFIGLCGELKLGSWEFEPPGDAGQPGMVHLLGETH